MMQNYQVTGNEYLSLPTIRETDGAAEGVTFLYMQAKGMLELRGDNGLIRPWIAVDGERRMLVPSWRRVHFWIPVLEACVGTIIFRCTYLTPIGERAFGLRLEARNDGDEPADVSVGVEGMWDRTLHEINEKAELPDNREVKRSAWNHMFVWSQRPALPLFAFAPIVGDDQPFSEFDQGATWTQEGFGYGITRTERLERGQSVTLDVFFGVGCEEVSAATAAKELLRRGFDVLLAETEAWLVAREKHVTDPKLNEILNTNLFFAFFYASGRCVDTEELCLMTSRSPRYYVSAAYWDRDSLLWAFPAILSADAVYAREILVYVFTKQSRNFGIHSRFIDGTVLEPGFELDELCAPVIALQRYLDATGDEAFAQQAYVLGALERILETLAKKKHPAAELYETFLQPTDDMRNYPYLTYDNVLVWRAYRALATILRRPGLAARAEAVRCAVVEHCVIKEKEKPFFAWSIDLKGGYDIYDEPPGSLQLLPFYGFCESDDPVWQETVAIIRDRRYAFSFADAPIAEIGCRHAPHPWVLSLCNSLLSGHAKEAREHLMLTRMDNGIACESVNEHTGDCETGEAFATCAGFLAYAIEQSVRQRK
jgi:hypothetical protein